MKGQKRFTAAYNDLRESAYYLNPEPTRRESKREMSRAGRQVARAEIVEQAADYYCPRRRPIHDSLRAVMKYA